MRSRTSKRTRSCHCSVFQMVILQKEGIFVQRLLLRALSLSDMSSPQFVILLKKCDRRAEYLESFENKPDNMSETHLLLCKAGQAKEQDPATAAFFRWSSCRKKGSSSKGCFSGLFHCRTCPALNLSSS